MVHETIHVGVVIIFGVVLIPVYAMLLAWFTGEPRDLRSTFLGLGYLVGILAGIVVATFVGGFAIGLIMGA